MSGTEVPAGAGSGAGAGAVASDAGSGGRKRPRSPSPVPATLEEALAALAAAKAELHEKKGELFMKEAILTQYMKQDNSLLSLSQLSDSAGTTSDGSRPTPSPPAKPDELARLKAELEKVKRRPRVGVGVFVVAPDHPGCLLLGQRIGSHGAGSFQLPGGHLEFDEELETCALRELEEETGLTAPASSCTFATANNNLFKAEGKHYVTVFMKVVVAAGSRPERLEPDKCLGWEWVPVTDLPSKTPLFLPLKRLVESGKLEEALA